MGLDRVMKEAEIPWSPNFAPDDVWTAERAVLQDADVFAFFYPIWLNAPPAILKGYLERVFGTGFAYAREGAGNAPLLKGRKFISFTSSGAPAEWVIQSGAWGAMRALFDSHFAAVCGMQVLDHVHFGSVTPGLRADSVEADRATVRKTFAQHFGTAKRAATG